jgi:hypothetical protein
MDSELDTPYSNPSQVPAIDFFDCGIAAGRIGRSLGEG